MIEFVQTYLSAFWQLLTEMAPWLLLGFLFAGLLKAFFPSTTLNKYLGKNNLHSVLNATLLGIPLPLCSCGVIPTGVSFYKNGASKSATQAFLISTPQTGIDSILATYALMGLPFAFIRPLIAWISGIVGGVISMTMEKDSQSHLKIETSAITYENLSQKQSFTEKLKTALSYGFVDMMQDIAQWLLIGLLLAALISALLPNDFFEQYIGSFWGELLVVLVISIPLYVCATGSIPIAAALLLKGISPAAAILFLMAGPATNLVTMTVIGKTMGKKSLISYLISIIGCGILFAAMIHYLIPETLFLKYLPQITLEHSGHTSPWSLGMTILLFGLLIYGLLSPYFIQNQNLIMEEQKTTFRVEGMSCNHCKASVEKNVSQIAGVEAVNVNLAEKTVAVSGEFSSKEVGNTISELGFEVLDK